MSTPENSDCEGMMKLGKIGWSELITSDPLAAIQFYTAMFGWETEPFTAGDGEYTIFKLDGMPFGGVMKTPREDVPTHWLNYVSVADLDAMIARCNDQKGEVVVPPMPILTVGRIAIIKDPQGAVIGLHEAPKE